MAGENEAVGRAPALELSDDFLDKYLGDGDEAGAGADDGTLSDETEAGDEETGDDQETDDPEGGTEDEGEEDDSEEADGNEEPEDEAASAADEDEDSETDADEEETTFLDKKTLQRHQAEINKNPHLKAVYKSMQADYTRKTQEVARVKGEFEQGLAEFNEFDTILRDVTEGGGREMFLIDAAVDNPEAFQRAFDRAAELLEDPEARKKYERERTVDQKERQLQRREQQDQARYREVRVQEVRALTEELAADFGITDPEGLDLVKEAVARVILENRQAKKHQDVFVTDEQVEVAVTRAARALRAVRAKGEQQSQRKLLAERQTSVKKAARDAKRIAPKGKRGPSALPAPKVPKDAKPEEALNARINQLLG